MNEKESLVLYHGSKSGIKGKIMPVSRKSCDFGSGFYMGTERSQPLTLICNFPQAKFYTLELNMSGLNRLNLEAELDWALFIAYNRGKMEGVKGSVFYQKYADMGKGCDLVSGYIADDRMFMVLDRFFSGEITDKALVESLSVLKLGKQYVAVTEKACKQITILEEKSLDVEQREQWKILSEKNRREGISKAEEICRKYRREGRYFDEIIEGETEI